ncbi:gamma-butyrobetaine dioxygenase-like [Argopecten irradians]|uniref:gamma-butyrobetaine dioxygenase-like n=1 Tax=Argopecten irradians TaxID=31199 RepID=UPI00371FE108
MAMLNAVLRTFCKQTVGRYQHVSALTGSSSVPVRWIKTNSKLLSSVQQVQVVDGGKKLNVTWDDGKSFDFHSIWLRFQCPCSNCREESSGLFRTRPADIPLGLKIKDAVKTDNGDVQVQWKEEQHHGHFSQDFLHQHIYSKDQLQAKKEVSRPVFKRSDGCGTLNEDGLAKLSGGSYGERLLSNFSPRFDENVRGGVTRFLDMYQVLSKFRVEHPNEFKTLCRVPISIQMEYENSDYPVLMSKRRPMIYLDDYGDVISVVWHTYMHAPLEVPEEDVEEFYNAYQLLGRAVEFSEDAIDTKLKPGEVIAFNNRRMLHARSAYEEGGSGKRHFQGGYLSGDDFKSRLLVLAKKMGDPRPAIRIGNNDWR